MSKAAAKETIAASLPVQEGVLQAHQAVVAALTTKLRHRKMQERQQVREKRVCIHEGLPVVEGML
jgi:hypothetical protein